jgi:HEAT repeat protein
LAIRALASSDAEVGNRAEWTLVNAGPAVLSSVRQALRSESKAVRERAIRILAWQGDTVCIPALMTMLKSNAADPALVAWAIAKIQAFGPYGDSVRTH